MKRLYLVLTVLLSSFLLLSGIEVKADEITIDISDTYPFLLNNDISTFKNIADNKLLEDSSYTDYLMLSMYNSTKVLIIYLYNNQHITFGCTNGLITNSTVLNNHTLRCTYNIDSSLDSCVTNGNRIYNLPLYSSYDIPFVVNNNTYIFTYNDLSYSFLSDGSSFLPTAFQIKSYWDSHSEPVDNTPLLTSFYTFVLVKITYFCNFMATNTLFLTMLVIIILITIIELIFRRRL